jgi:fructokinase
MSYDVTTFGELVIDLVPLRSSESLAYLAKPGGAPANVAAGISRLGRRAAMISKVGMETFGEAALTALGATGVEVSAVVRTSRHNTALAVVAETATGEAEFTFYRENCADVNLSESEVPVRMIASSRVLHVGTLALATPISAAAQRRAISIAKESGVVISTDPNFRPAFWSDRGQMLAAGREVIGSAKIVKLNQAELRLLTGLTNTEEAARSLWHPGLIVLAVTKGAAGADLFTADWSLSEPGFAVEPVDTVGCGDAFFASLLADCLDSGLRITSVDALREIGVRSCAAGAIIATRSGALESMPSREEIARFLAKGHVSMSPAKPALGQKADAS